MYSALESICTTEKIIIFTEKSANTFCVKTNGIASRKQEMSGEGTGVKEVNGVQTFLSYIIDSQSVLLKSWWMKVVQATE